MVLSEVCADERELLVCDGVVNVRVFAVTGVFVIIAHIDRFVYNKSPHS